MVAFFKALPFGIALTILVCLFIGSGGSSGGILNVTSFHVDVMDFNVKLYWSWSVFVAGTLLAWFLILMMD